MTSIESIKLVHHCHTDIGYTHDQPVLWDLQRRFIDTALDLAWADRDEDDPGAFKWTVETTAPLLLWLREASDERLERFLRLEDAGRIEVTGMFLNITPLYGSAQLRESLRPVRYLRDRYDCTIKYAMNCDVNGQNWPLADTLLDAGLDGFSMAINEHFGGTPIERPAAFRWEAPSGRDLLALNGYHYSTGWQMGIGHDIDALRETWWPRVRDQLERVDYPLPSLLIQSYHPFADNAPAYAGFPEFVREWNDQPEVESGELPTLEMATPADWWEIAETHAAELPVYRGDWTDFWNFGAGSSAYETGLNRASRRRLRTAEMLEAGLDALGDPIGARHPTRRSGAGTRSDAWWALNLYDEHTWGADTAISVPTGDDAQSQWHHKASYAYRARSLSQMLRRDGVAELGRHVETPGGGEQ